MRRRNRERETNTKEFEERIDDNFLVENSNRKLNGNIIIITNPLTMSAVLSLKMLNMKRRKKLHMLEIEPWKKQSKSE
jgi:hypothetical protein